MRRQFDGASRLADAADAANEFLKSAQAFAKASQRARLETR